MNGPEWEVSHSAPKHRTALHHEASPQDARPKPRPAGDPGDPGITLACTGPPAWRHAASRFVFPRGNTAGSTVHGDIAACALLQAGSAPDLARRCSPGATPPAISARPLRPRALVTDLDHAILLTATAWPSMYTTPLMAKDVGLEAGEVYAAVKQLRMRGLLQKRRGNAAWGGTDRLRPTKAGRAVCVARLRAEVLGEAA